MAQIVKQGICGSGETKRRVSWASIGVRGRNVCYCDRIEMTQRKWGKIEIQISEKWRKIKFGRMFEIVVEGNMVDAKESNQGKGRKTEGADESEEPEAQPTAEMFLKSEEEKVKCESIAQTMNWIQDKISKEMGTMIEEAKVKAFLVRMFRATSFHLMLEYKCRNGCWMGIEGGKKIERRGIEKYQLLNRWYDKWNVGFDSDMRLPVYEPVEERVIWDSQREQELTVVTKHIARKQRNVLNTKTNMMHVMEKGVYEIQQGIELKGAVYRMPAMCDYGQNGSDDFEGFQAGHMGGDAYGYGAGSDAIDGNARSVDGSLEIYGDNWNEGLEQGMYPEEYNQRGQYFNEFMMEGENRVEEAVRNEIQQQQLKKLQAQAMQIVGTGENKDFARLVREVLKAEQIIEQRTPQIKSNVTVGWKAYKESREVFIAKEKKQREQEKHGRIPEQRVRTNAINFAGEAVYKLSAGIAMLQGEYYKRNCQGEIIEQVLAGLINLPNEIIAIKSIQKDEFITPMVAMDAQIMIERVHAMIDTQQRPGKHIERMFRSQMQMESAEIERIWEERRKMMIEEYGKTEYARQVQRIVIKECKENEAEKEQMQTTETQYVQILEWIMDGEKGVMMDEKWDERLRYEELKIEPQSKFNFKKLYVVGSRNPEALKMQWAAQVPILSRVQQKLLDNQQDMVVELAGEIVRAITESWKRAMKWWCEWKEGKRQEIEEMGLKYNAVEEEQNEADELSRTQVDGEAVLMKRKQERMKAERTDAEGVADQNEAEKMSRHQDAPNGKKELAKPGERMKKEEARIEEMLREDGMKKEMQNNKVETSGVQRTQKPWEVRKPMVKQTVEQTKRKEDVDRIRKNQMSVQKSKESEMIDRLRNAKSTRSQMDEAEREERMSRDMRSLGGSSVTAMTMKSRMEIVRAKEKKGQVTFTM